MGGTNQHDTKDRLFLLCESIHAFRRIWQYVVIHYQYVADSFPLYPLTVWLIETILTKYFDQGWWPFLKQSQAQSKSLIIHTMAQKPRFHDAYVSLIKRRLWCERDVIHLASRKWIDRQIDQSPFSFANWTPIEQRHE